MMDVGQMAKREPEDKCASSWAHPKPWASALGRLAKVWTVLAVVALVAIVTAACGGGGEPAAEESPTPPPTGEEAALAPCRALQALKTYRYSVNDRLESPEPAESPPEGQPTPTSTLVREFTGPFLFEYDIDASLVAPDRIEALITAGGSQFGMIVISDQTWIESEGRWMQGSRDFELPYKPPDVCEAILAEVDLSQVEPQEEKVNDVKTLHYTLSQVPSGQAIAKIFGPGSDMDILIETFDVELWLAEKDQWPVRMDISGSGLYADGRELQVHLLIDIRDANSGDIQVEPPI